MDTLKFSRFYQDLTTSFSGYPRDVLVRDHEEHRDRHHHGGGAPAGVRGDEEVAPAYAACMRALFARLCAQASVSRSYEGAFPGKF